MCQACRLVRMIEKHGETSGDSNLQYLAGILRLGYIGSHDNERMPKDTKEAEQLRQDFIRFVKEKGTASQRSEIVEILFDLIKVLETMCNNITIIKADMRDDDMPAFVAFLALAIDDEPTERKMKAGINFGPHVH